MKLSIVIPVYGCREALIELYERIVSSLEKMECDFEIVLVNDACPQNSWEIIAHLCKQDSRVIGIEMSRNFGQMKAILAGLDHASGEWIVVMDCDLQDSPEDIHRLYEKAMEGYDVVFSRRKNRKDSRETILLSNVFYKIYKYATDGNYDRALSNFSIVHSAVIKNYCAMREQHRAYVMYLRWLGFKQAVIEVEHNERYSGSSSYTFKKRYEMALGILTSQSDKILRLFVGLGFIVSLIAFFSIIGMVIFKFTANVAVGWTSLIATNVLIGGILMMVMGIVGIYVGNIFMQTKGRPLYVVRQIVNDKKEE